MTDEERQVYLTSIGINTDSTPTVQPLSSPSLTDADRIAYLAEVYGGTTSPQVDQELQTQPTQQPPASPSLLHALGIGLRETGVAGLQGVNAALGGIPRTLYERPVQPNPRLDAFGYTPNSTPRVWPTPQTPEGRFIGAVDTGLGAMVGLPGKAMNLTAQGVGKVAPKIPGWVARAASGAVGGTAFDAAKPDTYARNAVLGAAGNVLLPSVVEKAARMFRKTPPGKLLSDPEFEQLAGKVRQAVGGGKLAAGLEFDEGITAAVNAKPEVATPVSDFLDTLMAEMKADATVAAKIQAGMLRSARQGNTTLQAMLQDPSRAATATGRDLQNIKQTLQAIPSIDRVLQRTYAIQASPKAGGRFDASVSEADLSLIDHISTLKERLLSAYPELQADYAAYSQFMSDYRTLAPRLRTGTIESTLLGKYGNALQRQAAGRVLPSEILQQVEQVRGQHQTALATLKQSKEFRAVLKRLGYDVVKWGVPSYIVGRGVQAGLEAVAGRK